MDIHFCDLCGVRVTEVDLRGGHGLRRQYDVICATCLELGHGKEWLAKHTRKRPAAAAPPVKAKALAAAASGASAPSKGASPTIDAARDRVRTLDDEVDATPAAPVRVIADDDDPPSSANELALDDHTGTAEVEPKADVAAPTSGFAAAANGFAALAASPKAPIKNRGKTTIDVDDVQLAKAPAKAKPVLEEPDIEADDDAAGAPAKASPGSSPTDEIVAAASPFAYDTGDERAEKAEKTDKSDSAATPAQRIAEAGAAVTPDKSETVLTKRSATNKDETEPGDRMAPKSERKPSTTNVTRKGVSSKVSKSKTSKSVRTRPGAKNSKAVWMISGVTLTILIIVLVTIGVNRTGGKTIQREEAVNFTSVQKDINDTIKLAQGAYKSGKLDQMNVALTKIHSLEPDVEMVSKVAQTKGHYTDEQLGQRLEQIGWPKLRSYIRLLNDERAKLLPH